MYMYMHTADKNTKGLYIFTAEIFFGTKHLDYVLQQHHLCVPYLSCLIFFIGILTRKEIMTFTKFSQELGVN